MARSDDHSVRAQYPIKKGMIVTIRFTAFLRSNCNDLFGVVASNCNGDYNVKVWDTSSEIYKHSYGLRSLSDQTVYYSGQKTLDGWPSYTIPAGKQVEIVMIVDYASLNECCLTFRIDNKFIGPTDTEYSMKLPNANCDWYPIVCFHYDESHCTIECYEQMI
eukprot:546811_1